MAFAQALQKAEQLGGQSINFEQSIDCCTGFAAQWIKYQLLDRDFWSSPPPHKPPIFTSTLVRFTIKADQSTFQTTRFKSTDAGNTKIQKIYDSIDQDAIDRGKAGKGTVDYLTRSKKLGGQLDMLGLKQVEGKFSDLSGLIQRLRDPAYRGAFHLSLQVGFDHDSGVNPLYNSGGSSFHSVAAFRGGDDRVRFFDPNMGEVSIPRDKFEEWFRFYKNLWKDSKMYNKYDAWFLTYIKGVDGLSTMRREVRTRLKHRLRRRQDYLLSSARRVAPVRPPAMATLPPPTDLPPPPPAPIDLDFAALDASLATLTQWSAELGDL